MSRHRNRTAVAKRLAGRKIRRHRINRRIGVHRNLNLIARSTAQRVQLQSFEGVFVCTKRRNNRVGQGRSTGDSSRRVEPLILHVRRVPVVQVGGQRDLATFANVRLGSRDVDHRNRVNEDMRLSRSLTTVFVNKNNIEVVSIISVIARENNCILMDTLSGIRKKSVVLIPIEVVISRRSRIDISNQRDVVAGLLANERIGFDSQRRVRGNLHRVSERHIGLTTGSRLADRYRVSIVRSIITNSTRSLCVNSTNSVRNNLTVAIPCEDLTTRNTTAHVSRHRNRTAVAKRLACRKISRHRINRRIGVHRNLDLIARSLTQGVQLQSLEAIFMSTQSRSNRVGQ